MSFEFGYAAPTAAGPQAVNQLATNYLANRASLPSDFAYLPVLIQQGHVVVGTARVYVDAPTPWQCIEITSNDPDHVIQSQLDLAIGVGRGCVVHDDLHWARTRRWFLLDPTSYASIHNRADRKKQRDLDLLAIKMAVDDGAN
jgi:hypothetical protein